MTQPRELTTLLPRLAEWLAGSSTLPEGGSLAVLKSKGLIPASLVQRCAAFSPGLDGVSAESLAVDFAASLFPQKAFMLEAAELDQRLELFFDAWRAVASGRAKSLDQVVIDRLRENPNSPWTRTRFDQLLGALTSVGATTSVAEDEVRRAGASVALASLPSEDFAILARRLESEAGFMEFLVSGLASPPSMMADCVTSAGYPDWPRVRRELAARFPDALPEYLALAEQLERSVWKFIGGLPVDQHAMRVQAFWEYTFGRLVSGFPYFSFRSRFVYWWGRSLERFDFQRLQREVYSEELFEEEFESTALTEDHLRLYREGWRLVRASFSMQAATRPAGLDERQGDEAMRSAVDEIWLCHLERLIEGDDAHVNKLRLIRERVQKDHPYLSEHAIENTVRRVKKRIWGYTLSRIGRSTNNEIRFMRPPAGFGHGNAGKYPLEKEPAILPIISLARTTLVEDTFLWACEAAWRGPWAREEWDEHRWVVELWHWMRWIGLDREPCDRRSDRLLREALTSEPELREFWMRLERIETRSELDDFLAQVRIPKPFPLDLEGLFARHPLSSWRAESRRWTKLAASHWHAPAWYLAVVEGLSVTQAVRRLKPDAEERDQITDLVTEMQQFNGGSA